MLSSLNLSGSVNALRFLWRPSLCVPHHACATFNDIPTSEADGGLIRIHSQPAAHCNNVDGKPASSLIKAIVLDKDNCFAIPHENTVYPAYKDKFEALKRAYPNGRILIVSNTAGTRPGKVGEDDPEAVQLEKTTGVPVLRHFTKKPGCAQSVLDHFKSTPELSSAIKSPSEIAVIGDRLFTDVMLANMMGAHAIWIHQGVIPNTSVFSSLERFLHSSLQKANIGPPEPQSDFE